MVREKKEKEMVIGVQDVARLLAMLDARLNRIERNISEQQSFITSISTAIRHVLTFAETIYNMHTSMKMQTDEINKRNAVYMLAMLGDIHGIPKEKRDKLFKLFEAMGIKPNDPIFFNNGKQPKEPD